MNFQKSLLMVLQYLNKPKQASIRLKAFTVLELLIVIAVSSILIGIAITKIKGMQDQSNIVKAQHELSVLQNAMELYYSMNTRQYPPTSTSVGASYLVNSTPQTIPNPLYDPFAAANMEYNYMLSSNGQYYIIYSVGATKQGSVSAIDNSGNVSANASTICVTTGTGCQCQAQGLEAYRGACSTTITIVAATYGSNCGCGYNNVGSSVAALCNGKVSCSFVEGNGEFGDCSSGCAKNFVVSYECSGSSSKSVQEPSRSGENYTVSLSCP
jgi:prepilin-type N-terminal cleavage/methylation domain-containing protein